MIALNCKEFEKLNQDDVVAKYQAYRQELFDFCDSRGFVALQSDLDELEDIVKKGLGL